MQQALINRFVSSIDEVTKKQDDKLVEAITSLEGRIKSSIKDDQLQFQSDIRSTLTAMQASKPHRWKEVTVTMKGKLVESVKEVRVGGERGGVAFGVGSGGGAGLGTGSGMGLGPGYGNGSGYGGKNSWRHKKLDLPLFNGTNPDGWILRAERFFNFYGLTEEEKVEATVVALEGQALLWFQWEHRRRPIDRWDQIKALLRRQFHSQATGTLQEQWLAHRQGGTVTDYRLKFIELLAPLDNASEELALGQFLDGPREEIRAEVRLLGPMTVDHAMELAHNG